MVEASARATRQLRISPGGKISNCWRILPDEPPSSATVTMAVILDVYSLRPVRRVERPVPPPTVTTLGPRASCLRWYNISTNSFSRVAGMTAAINACVRRLIPIIRITIPKKRINRSSMRITKNCRDCRPLEPIIKSKAPKALNNIQRLMPMPGYSHFKVRVILVSILRL